MKQNRFERIERVLGALIQRKGAERLKSKRIRFLLWNLQQLSKLYLGAVKFRLWLYAKGIMRHHALGCQVVSIGNLTVGGTGKTPVVEVFARELQKEGRNVAILSRGYKKVEPSFIKKLLDTILMRDKRRPPRVVSDGKQLLLDSAMSGDEPYMLASNLPNVAVLVDKDRVKSGRYAINKLGCDTLVLDDGFQYMKLKHMLEVVLVDRTNPFGNEHYLPRGILREPIRNIKRADFVFVTKCNGSSTEVLKKRVRELNSEAEIIECQHCERHLKHAFTGETFDLDYLHGKKVFALSGIAVPMGFEGALEKRGAVLLDKIRFVDHHRYSQQEVIDIINKAKADGAEAIITTEKDAVRLPRPVRCDVPILFLRVDIDILSGEEDFKTCIARICFRDRQAG